jgi:hypothetical protein
MRKTNIRIYSLHCHIYRALIHCHIIIHWSCHIQQALTSIALQIYHSFAHSSIIFTHCHCHIHQVLFIHGVIFIKLFFSLSPSSNFYFHISWAFHSSDITQSVLFIEVDHSLSYIAVDTLLKLFYSLSHSSSLIIRCHLRRGFFIHCHNHQNFQWIE